MNPRVITATVGGLMLLCGIAALLEPELVMEHVLGYAVHPRSTEAFVHGEVRAIYGGIFTVLGVFTVMAAVSPHLHRGRILLMGTVWLGISGGRVFGALTDGSPGLYGWGAALLEALLGTAMLLAAQSAAPPVEPGAAVRSLGTGTPAPGSPQAPAA